MQFKPHSYQAYCINRLLTDTALALFLGMGLGKTVATLTAINDLKRNRFAITKALVIAPKKVAEGTWNKEQKKWDHLAALRIIRVLGTQQQRIRALNTPGDVYVINRENVQWLVAHYQNAWPFEMVVIDESTSFKSHKAKRLKALSWVRPHIQRIVELTGTPAPNGLLDLWAQVYLLDQGQRLGKNYGGFRSRYFEPGRRDESRVFSYDPRPGAEEIIHQLLSDICISMKTEDYIDLPELIYDVFPVVLDSKARAAYKQLEKKLLLEVDGRTINAGSAAVLGNKLLQLCNGAVYDEDRNVAEIHQCKIEAFQELVERLNGQPALVFYNFQHDRDRLLAALKGTGLRVRELKTTADEDAWNAREVDIMLTHPASSAYGLNLQDGGNHIIWFGLNWSLELFQQAIKRLHRQGQLQKVICHLLVVEGGVDEDVMAAQEQKGATQDRLIDALRVRIDRAKGA